jgi:hypothetical protein
VLPGNNMKRTLSVTGGEETALCNWCRVFQCKWKDRKEKIRIETEVKAYSISR